MRTPIDSLPCRNYAESLFDRIKLELERAKPRLRTEKDVADQETFTEDYRKRESNGSQSGTNKWFISPVFVTNAAYFVQQAFCLMEHESNFFINIRVPAKPFEVILCQAHNTCCFFNGQRSFPKQVSTGAIE